MTAQEITKGVTVYGAGGEKMGTIQAYNAHGGYLVVWMCHKRGSQAHAVYRR